MSILSVAARLLSDGKYRRARRLLLPVEPSPRRDSLLGQCHVGMHEYGAAITCLERALAGDGGDRTSQVALAKAYTGLGEPHRAIPILEGLLAGAPGDPALREALATACRRDARYADAIRVAGDGPATTQLRYDAALSLHALGEAGAALAAFDAVLEEKPDLAAGWFGSHACALSAEGRDAAMARLRRAVACPGANAKYWSFLAAYALLEGRAGDAAGIEGERLAGHAGRMALPDGVSALLPRLAPDWRLFGVSADVLRHGLALADRTGVVLEFGVRRGTSTAHIAAAAGQAVHGFDSFTGLPEAWGNEPRGVFSTGAELPPVPGNVTLHPGWFDDTLGPFLAAHPGPVRFANIDCDIYSSTRTVLTALEGRIGPGTVLVFDEFIGNRTWAEHEYRAWTEFTAETGLGWQVAALSPFTGQAVVLVS